MKVLLFGATGMIGQGVLRECLQDPDVRTVLSVGRSSTGMESPKLRELIHGDLFNYSAIKAQLSGFSACFFCLGVSSSGISESEYERITYAATVAAAEALYRLSPRMTFIYVSGAGTDSSERGRVRWARVKGRTENALLKLFERAYMFRPGLIQPLDGIKSKTGSYRFFYTLSGPVLPLLRRILPNQILTTRQMGRAMLAIAKRGYSKRVLESRDIRAAAGR